MKAETFQRSALLLLVAVISCVFVWMVRDFLMALMFAALFSSFARPLYLRFIGWTGDRKRLSSGLTLLVLVFLFILPLFLFFGVVAAQAVKVTQEVGPWVQGNLQNKQQLDQNLQRVPGYHHLLPYRDQILSKLGELVSGLGGFIFRGASAVTAGTVVFLVNFVIMLYSMFFFFVDGPAILHKVLYYFPLKDRDERKILNGFQSMARATIKGLVVVGMAQGALAGLAFWVAGIPSSLFWGTVMALLSVVPNIGAALVWAPACIFLFVKGNTAAATVLFLWCAFVVGSVDNVLRPILVGKDSEVPQLLILLSTLGGLTMLGLSGFVLGPVIALLFVTIWDIYGVTFQDVLPASKE